MLTIFSLFPLFGTYETCTPTLISYEHKASKVKALSAVAMSKMACINEQRKGKIEIEHV